MKSEAEANGSLVQAVETFQAEKEAWAKKLAAPVKVVRPAVKPVKVSLFNRLFGV